MPHTDPCLGPTGVGVLDSNNHLTVAARDAFTAEVIALLTSGNADGKGAKISSLLDIPFPPKADFRLLDPDRILTNPDDILGDVFWFSPSPFAPLTFDTLRDPGGGYQKTIVTFLYQPLMQAINLNGKGAPPLIDVSGLLPDVDLTIPDLLKITLGFPLSLPAIALELGIPEIGDLPTILANLVPPIPQFPELPEIPSFDFVILLDLVLKLVEIPALLLPQLIAQLPKTPDFYFPPDPGKLFELILDVFFDLLFEILKDLGLLTMLPKLLVATVIVTLQNAVAAMVPMLISQVIGTGLVVRTVGQALGLA